MKYAHVYVRKVMKSSLWGFIWVDRIEYIYHGNTYRKIIDLAKEIPVDYQVQLIDLPKGAR